jgi:hypothetical protein
MADTPNGISRDAPFGPRDLLLSALACDIIAAIVLAPFATTALAMGWVSLVHRFPGGPSVYALYPVGLLFGVVLFVWAWRRRQRWLPGLIFLGFSGAFWFCILWPWRGFGR